MPQLAQQQGSRHGIVSGFSLVRANGACAQGSSNAACFGNVPTPSGGATINTTPSTSRMRTATTPAESITLQRKLS